MESTRLVSGESQEDFDYDTLYLHKTRMKVMLLFGRITKQELC